MCSATYSFGIFGCTTSSACRSSRAIEVSTPSHPRPSKLPKPSQGCLQFVTADAWSCIEHANEPLAQAAKSGRDSTQLLRDSSTPRTLICSLSIRPSTQPPSQLISSVKGTSLLSRPPLWSLSLLLPLSFALSEDQQMLHCLAQQSPTRRLLANRKSLHTLFISGFHAKGIKSN